MGLIRALEWFVVLYFVVAYAGCVALHLLAIPALVRRIALRPFEDLPSIDSGFEPPVSVLVPASEAEATIADEVTRLLALDYPEFEVVVVNDGSADGTLAILKEAFELEPFPEALWRRINTMPVRTVYQSRRHPNLRVVDKERGGRADCLNTGINASRYPLFCCVEAGMVLERDGLRRMVEPFLDDRTTIVSATPIRIATGATFGAAGMESVALPRRLLALLQIVEQLRTYLFARAGWAALKSVAVVCDDFLVLRKDVVVESGGFYTSAVNADMELVLRLQRVLRGRRERYATHFVPDAVCWGPAPASLAAHAKQRLRWQRGIAESVRRNHELFTPRGGARRFTLPLMLAIERYGPAVELAGLAFMAGLYALGAISGGGFLAFLAMVAALGLAGSMSAVFLEEASFDFYPRPSQMALLVAIALVENLGYRQAVLVWRTAGLAPATRRPRA